MYLTAKPRVVVGHAIWGRGGAESAAMWTLQALIRDFDVTVYTRGGFVLEELNNLAGTSLVPSNLKIDIAHGANRFPLGRLAHAAYLRSLARFTCGYDLRVTASGVMMWGAPALHFISSATWNAPLATRFGSPNAPANQGVLKTLVSLASHQLAQQGHRSEPRDVFVANSRWTAKQSSPYCGSSIEVIYPPVLAAPSLTPWADREDAILVLGRISPEKNIELAIQLADKLDQKGQPLRLYIAGPSDEPEYFRRIQNLSRDRSGLIELLPILLGPEKQRMLSKIKYGFSACKLEAFGMATAEMVNSGMIVLVPTECGQSEVVQNDLLEWETLDDAVEIFSRLICDPPLQLHLHKEAVASSGRFSARSYVEGVQRIAATTMFAAKRQIET